MDIDKNRKENEARRRPPQSEFFSLDDTLMHEKDIELYLGYYRPDKEFQDMKHRFIKTFRN